jgi:hypothetical protein
MPIPKRNRNETPPAFMKRCMSDSVMVEEYTSERQRYAVCISNIYDSDETFTDYPQAATDNAKRALKYLRESGNPNNCLTPVGFARANQLAKREPISLETVKRMAAFVRHKQHKDVPYDKGCGGIGWDAWGGDEGIEYAINKIKP